MRRRNILKLRPWVPRWRACVCVLLIGLVVYNPFAALNGSSSHLSYEKLARNRATLGSSELQHFSPVLDPFVQPDLDRETGVSEAVAAVQEIPPGLVQPEVSPIEPELYASLWFRPPPSQ